jgi:hypothetical protein
MDDKQIEGLAAVLTKAGKECLDWVRPHSLIAPYRRGAAEIERLGLVKRQGAWFHITPLGLALRAHIAKENGHD